MNYYIDFDKTLYDSMALTDAMLNLIISFINKEKGISTDLLKEECVSMFNREHIYDIFKLTEYFADKYSVDASAMHNKINQIITNGSCFVYDDVIPFLTKLKNSGHNVFMLTVNATKSMSFQTKKVLGSGLTDYFNVITITEIPKHLLDINYENGIFIDDNPKDLLGLYSKNPKEVIRLRRDRNKYSVIDLDINIKEYKTLDEIPII